MSMDMGYVDPEIGRLRSKVVDLESHCRKLELENKRLLGLVQALEGQLQQLRLKRVK